MARNIDELRARYNSAVKHPGGPGPMMGRGPGMRRGPGGKPKNMKKTIKRLLNYVGRHKFKLAAIFLCMLFTTVTSLLASYMIAPIIDRLTVEIFPGKVIEMSATEQIIDGVIQKITEIKPISDLLLTKFGAVSFYVFIATVILAFIYVVSVVCSYLEARLMLSVSQNSVEQIRCDLFNKLQKLPVKYFDSNPTGEIMSRFTNDIDNIDVMLNNSLTSIVSGVVTIIGTFFFMLTTNIWLTLVTVFFIPIFIKGGAVIGKLSSKYYVSQQAAIGAVNGYIEETVSGQKVIKVFNHEKEALADFDQVNNALFEDSARAHAYANTLGPIIGNIGNILYVIMAVTGGVFLLSNVPNVSLGGFAAFSISIVVPFLNMAKQFTGNVNQASQQINAVVMGMAGGSRLFELMDEEPEPDDGYVTLVNAKYDENGNLTESDERTGLWAWKHPHKAEGTVTYTELKGDVRLVDVDFAYEEGKPVLHDISVYAEPGQKVAFVGATGAGKTTITNLINRFYDIADGKVRYDGININKIKKSDLRRSLGIVLQETNLFTGSVMENIRYGRLDATDEECIAAAKLAGADDFITRLPGGYETELQNNGANLSQGQRQLIAIARAAVADPPVMILDEATSSIDTRTEAIVQRGMDKLMEGRTVFVIAHRLSTVMDSDVIMVLDHGRIIERGNHDKLIAERGTYYQLYTGAFELE